MINKKTSSERLAMYSQANLKFANKLLTRLLEVVVLLLGRFAGDDERGRALSKFMDNFFQGFFNFSRSCKIKSLDCSGSLFLWLISTMVEMSVLLFRLSCYGKFISIICKTIAYHFVTLKRLQESQIHKALESTNFVWVCRYICSLT